MTLTRTHGRRARATALAVAILTIIAGVAAVEVTNPHDASALGKLGPLATGAGPSGIGINAAGTLAMVANTDDGTVTVIEIGEQFTVVDTITVGGEPTDVTFTPDGSEAWVATWSGNSVEIIDVDTLTVVDTVSAGAGSFSVVFSHDGAMAWVINYTGSSVGVVDTATRDLLRTISGLSLPQKGILSADGATLSLAMSGGGYARITTADDSVSSTAVGVFPLSIAATADESEHWLVDNSLDAVIIMDPGTGDSITSFSTGVEPTSVALAPNGIHMIVAATDGVYLYDVATRDLLTTFDLGDPVGGEVATVPGQDRVMRTMGLADDVHVLGFDQERLAGATRYTTAIEISERAFPKGTDTVFVANGLDFPDALSAGPAAGLKAGSLLLTPPTALPTEVIEEIERLDPSQIYVVGGTGVISAGVFAALRALQPNTVRLAGTDRYATSRAIVDRIWDTDDPAFVSPDRVFIATGRGFPDALSAGAAAAAFGDPVILVNGTASSIPAATLALIADLAPDEVYIAGGTGVVSSEIEAQLVSIYGPDAVDRLAGANRYSTSAAINAEIFPLHQGILYASGAGFADALAGVALAGRLQAPLYLVQKSCVQAAASSAIYTGQSFRLFLLGGTGALSTAVEALTPC